MFQRNITHASSWSKIKPSKKQQAASSIACCLLHAGFLLGLLFDPEAEGDHAKSTFNFPVEPVPDEPREV
jgi:hypothetical protein